MKKRRTREKRRKIDKKIIAVVLVAVFLIVLVVYQVITEMSRRKPGAEEYFEILEPIPFGSLSEDGSLLFMYSLIFNITAVGGDSHEVIVNSGGLGMVEPTWVGTILEGEEKTVFLSFETHPINLRLKEDQFHVSLRITSVEASGPVTISFPPPET